MSAASASALSPEPVSHEQLRAVHTALHTLATHLPTINHLLDSSFTSISDQFIQVSTLLARYDTLESSDPNRPELYQHMAQLVQKTIMDLQFQDRVSQNLVITINICRMLAEKLDAPSGGTIDEPLTRELVNLLNLGEIKQQFLAYAGARNWIENPEAMGISMPKAEAEPDDIELF